ncbi:hypothetical protein GGTG_04004 [Gaeumannomyces tritici R3-111a-1]|uniref:Uncharacterized protein n=1 Tax=Gaeumannomyces tritici (strain R3-111a-1) TaxID=644352 RepID=J3NRV5_GAET3|nr:hypothetical protein GGTG_04004 [Gaeumannomyces tritici R3-111a-1]EJT78911.1 hypothetical protein GGTG_04004 [Gaeumannomyces tritici R3-111a-1]
MDVTNKFVFIKHYVIFALKAFNYFPRFFSKNFLIFLHFSLFGLLRKRSELPRFAQKGLKRSIYLKKLSISVKLYTLKTFLILV